MSDQRVMKSYDELKFSDDFMFGKVMEDKELCREVLECLLQRPIGELQEIQTQKEIRYVEDGKPIRLDVYNKDNEGTVYDAEMQNLNKKTIEFHKLPKRSRFYQSAIDTDFLEKKNSYKLLPDSNVLFICTFDPFRKGLWKYTFSNRCEEDLSIQLNDGTKKVFFNCCYSRDDMPENLHRLYEYIKTGFVNDELTRIIDERVVEGRKNDIWRSQFVKERTIQQDSKDEERFDSIANMLRRGKTVEEIVDFCGYPYEQVKEVEKALLKPANS